MLRDKNSNFIITLVVVVLLLILPIIIKNQYYLRTVSTISIAIILTSGFRLVFRTGQLSLAQAAFFGVGAYSSAIMVMRFDLNSWISFLLAGLVSACIAGVIGYVTLRIKEVYFAIATLALNELFRLIWVEWVTLFGGPYGIVNIPSPDPIFGLRFGSIASFYYIAVLLLFFTVGVMLRIEKSRIGLTFGAIKESDNLAASVGINLMKEKVKAFMIACFFAGLAGAFFAHHQHYISPVDFSLMDSVYYLMYGVVGGLGSVWGPVAGCTVMGFIPVTLRLIPNYDPVIEPIIFGVILILMMRFEPNGLIGLLGRIGQLMTFKHKR